MKEVGYISEFLFGIYWWTWKTTLFIKKKCWSGPIKNVRILTFTMMYIFKKKTPEDIIILHLCTKNLDYMIYSSWNIDCDYGTFSSLSSTPKKPKNQNFKKNCWRYHHLTKVHQKPQPCKAQFLAYRVRQAKLFVILGNFLPFLSLSTQKIKIKKKWK